MKLHGFLLLFLLTLPLRAQVSGVPQSLLTVAVTATDAAGAPWAYLTWQATPGTLAYGQPLAIFVKNAAANAAGTFAPQGTTQIATELPLVKTQLSRASALGADAAQLAADLNVYYDVVRNNHEALKAGQTLPPANLSTEEKLARLIGQARADSRTAATLAGMSAVHPGVALCAGNAWAGRLTAAVGQAVTIEVRPCDPVSGQVGGVVARTSFNAGQPETMLAPGAPVQVPDLTPEGDRVVKLRWATGDNLRRQFPMLRGFQLYRSPKATAESLGWHTTTPSLATLRAALGNPSVVRKLGSGPISPGKLFSAANAADFSSPAGDLLTHFFLDDNERFAADAAGNIIGTAFPDGTAFYYFATASDLLGREGAVSPAGLGTACVRIPPPVPKNITLAEDNLTPADGSTPHQGLRLSWVANAPAGDNDTDFYEVLRGSEAETPTADFAQPETLPAPIAILPHAPDAEGRMSWRDATLPQTGNGETTWWYALRARHVSPCPPDNTSRLSPPLFGTLRSFKAPDAPTGASMFGCPLVGLYIPELGHGLIAGESLIEPRTGSPSPNNLRRVRLTFTRPDPAIDWIELKWTWTGQSPAAELLRYEFGPSNTLIVDTDVAWLGAVSPLLSARAGATTGATSRLVTTSLRTDVIPGWNASTQIRVNALTGLYALSEIRFENQVHRRMFALDTAPVSTAGSTPRDNHCASVPALDLPDHTPVIVTKLSPVTDQQTTVDGVEAMGGRYIFCDPEGSANTIYSAWSPQAGVSVCMHQADSVDGSIKPIRLRLALPPNVGEYRIYRSVDDGVLSLLAQGDGSKLPVNAAEVVREDQTLPANASRVAYFGQTFNRAGIGSALVPLGDRILVGRRDVASPQLKRPLPTGTGAAPAVRLEWFCPPDGIERFEIRFSPKSSGDAAALLPGGGLNLKTISVHSFLGLNGSGMAQYLPNTQTAFTGLVGGPMGNGPVFSLTQPVPLVKKFFIAIRAISKGGIAGPWSEAREFIWETPQPPPTPGPELRVAWPYRPLPAAGSWGPLLRANTFRYVTDLIGENKIWAPWHAGEYPAGVRIGRMAMKRDNPLSAALQYFPDLATVLANSRSIMSVRTNLLNNRLGTDPVDYLLRRGASAEDAEYNSEAAGSRPVQPDSLLPAVLYRQQIANTRYPTVSGDLIQVSPLIEKIAHAKFQNADLDLSIIRDPYIGVVSIEPPVNPLVQNNVSNLIDLYLLDTQPVVKGAAYRYTLMRLRADNGEIDEVLDAGDVTIPDTL